MKKLSGVLSEIISATSESLEVRKRKQPMESLKSEVYFKRRIGLFSESLAREGLSVIAEIKRASPSKGMLRPELDVAELAQSYEQAGAGAVSVLTDEKYFKGSLDDLKLARESCNLPLLRKDFIIDPYQVWEAGVAGADAVLLIVAALTGDELISLMREIKSAGLEALVEVHDGEDIQVAVDAGASIIGINNRDLSTFKVDLQTCLTLRNEIPQDILSVAESGIKGKKDAIKLKQAGFNAILVGELLMKSEDPGEMVRNLLSG